MTKSHRASLSCAALIVFILYFLSGCAASKTQTFAMSFLPAAPVLDVDDSLATPPVVSTPTYSSENANLIEKALRLPTAPSEVDSRLQRAQERFESGKKLYQQGEVAGARKEFDRAIEVLLSASENLPDRPKLERKLDQLVDSIYHYDLEGLGSGEIQQGVIYDKPPLDGILEMTFPTDPNLKPKVKEEIQATVSQLPLEENDSVLGYVNFFSSERGRRTLIAGLKKAARYRPLIQRILDEEGLPQELIYLAQVESGFLPRAKSYKAAVGMWQFVQWRGREYGLQQTASTDDRMDPERATRAAARHLRDLYTQFGDWYLAMAAYNCGPGCVDRAVQRTGFADFWELRNRNALPRDTMNYLPAILAVTIMAKNPKDYGLEVVDPDEPIEYDTISLTCPTNLALVADALGKSVSEIQELNPALLKTLAPAGYQLHIPKGTSAAMRAALDIVPEGRRATWRVHRVERGETIAEIAKRYAVSAGSIAEANNSAAQAPETGDLLAIPASYQRERPTALRSAAAKAAPQRHASARSSRTASNKVIHHRAGARTFKTASAASRSARSVN